MRRWRSEAYKHPSQDCRKLFLSKKLGKLNISSFPVGFDDIGEPTAASAWNQCLKPNLIV